MDQFRVRAEKQSENALSVPHIGNIMKDVKGLKTTNEENQKRYKDSYEDN